MRYRLVTPPKHQAGFGLIIGVFIIVIMALLVASMLNFYKTETQAGSTELMSLRAFQAASSLSDFGLRRALLGEKDACVDLVTGEISSCDCATNPCETVPLECDDPNDSIGPGDVGFVDDISFGPKPEAESVRMPNGQRQWQDDYMGFCEMVSLDCDETKIGIKDPPTNPPPKWAKDSYFVVRGTVECSIASDTYDAQRGTGEIYSVERFTVEIGAKLTASEKVLRTNCVPLGASGKCKKKL